MNWNIFQNRLFLARAIAKLSGWWVVGRLPALAGGAGCGLLGAEERTCVAGIDITGATALPLPVDRLRAVGQMLCPALAGVFRLWVAGRFPVLAGVTGRGLLGAEERTPSARFALYALSAGPGKSLGHCLGRASVWVDSPLRPA